jgi:hypothetical protein
LLAVTTFSQAGYELYGKRCLETLKTCFPGRIVAFYEQKPDIEGIDLRDFSEIPGVCEYLERLKRQPGADGTGPDGYDYRYDANKFCRKVFAQDAVFDEDQYVFWIDADCIALQPMPEKFMEALLSDVPFCYLGRKATYTETGFLGFNTKHEKFAEFRSKYLSYFTSGKIFSQLKGWHDCIAFDYARQGIPGRNLTPDGSGVGNVIVGSKVGRYLTHLKGARKFSDKHRCAPSLPA